MAGRLDIDSKRDHGTRVVVRLPAARRHHHFRPPSAPPCRTATS